MDISKKDWKLFRERLSGWQENYMEGLVKEYANFLNDDKKPASEKFWELEKRIKEDKRHPGVIMEMSKSEAIWDIVRLIRLKVITYDDLSDFSDELQNAFWCLWSVGYLWHRLLSESALLENIFKRYDSCIMPSVCFDH